MRISSVRAAIGVVMFVVGAVAPASAQTMEKVNYFPDSIAEKDDHVVRLNGGSSWLLANPTTKLPVAADVMVVMKDVMVQGKLVRAAWLYASGEEIPAQHVEGVFPANAAFLTRVVASEDEGTKLRLADGTELLVPGYNRFILNRWIPPYKVLISGNRLSLYNLKEGKRVQVQAATKPE
jgi:hypothetical protein